LTNLPLAMALQRQHAASSLPHDTACDSAEGTTRDSEGDFGPFDYCAWTALLLTNLPLAMPSAQHAAASLPHDTACDSAEGTTRDSEGDFGPFDYCAWTALLLTNLPLAMPSAQHAACLHCHTTQHVTVPEGTTRTAKEILGPSTTALGQPSS